MSEAATTEPAPSVSGLAPSATGITAPSNPDRHGAFLTDVIVELGFTDQDAVQEAVDASRQTAKTPERYLLDKGVIDERQLSLAVAERNCLDHVDLDQFEVDLGVAGLIDKPTASRYAALPIAFAPDGALLVAIEDPFNMLGISDIEVITRNEVRPVIAAGTQIQGLIESLPEQELPLQTELRQPPTPTPIPVGEPGPGSRTAPRPEQSAEPGATDPESSHDKPDPQATGLPEQGQQNTPNGPARADRVDAELGELAAALTAMQGQMQKVGPLLEAVESRIGELGNVDDRAQQTASELATQRAEFDRERQQSAEREQELEAELSAARGELGNVDDRAQQTASELATQRAEFDRERQQSAEREQELEAELSAARGELGNVDDRAQQTASELATQRAEFDRERQQSAEREQELEAELSAARGELGNVDDRAQQTASELATQRAEFDRERQQSAEREQELEAELSAARGELGNVDDRAQQTASELATQRAEFDRERQQSAEREQELEAELSAAREQIAALEERLSKVSVVAELASSATEKLTELQDVLRGEQNATL